MLPRLRRPLLAAAALASVHTAYALSESTKNIRGTVTGVTEVASTRWLKMQTLAYTDATGRKRKWDMTSRKGFGNKSAGHADSVAILALLRPGGGAPVETLLVRQYRPPMNAVTIELPAGLIDPGENPEQAALRELKEETGFVGSVAYCSGALALSPGMSDETCHLVTVEVDLTLEANQNPKQDLQDTELIQVDRVPVQKLAEHIRKKEKEGCIPFEGLSLLGVGVNLGAFGRP